METVWHCIQVGLGVYLGGLVLMLASWPLAYLVNLVMNVTYSWILKKEIKPNDLKMDYTNFGPPLWVLPVLSPLIIGLGSLFYLFACMCLIYELFVHRINPWIRSIKFRTSINLLPEWLSNDRLAAFLNKVIGLKS